METFKRGQVEQAIWNRFVKVQGREAKIPDVFRTRIRRLLELDRHAGAIHSTHLPHAMRYAFFDQSLRGRGRDVSFSAFNTFALALGLELLDSGFKQSEIVFFLRNIRPALQNEFAYILKHLPEFRAPRDQNRRVFMLIEKVELTEVFPRVEKKGKKREPLFLQPVFCHEIQELHDQLNKMTGKYRKTHVVEIAHTAKYLYEYL